MENCARLYPHHLQGEGHFTALLKKEGSSSSVCRQADIKRFSHPELSEFLSLISYPFEPDRITLLNDRILYLPQSVPPFASVRTLRSGLLLGTLKKNHFEPSQHLAQFLKPGMFKKEIQLSETDIRIEKYLHGETIRADEEYNGWVCVCAGKYPLGFGKQNGFTIKNKIEKGYRII
jgi:NOL1/NOP2/fmu family ribosome biogenesis protein